MANRIRLLALLVVGLLTLAAAPATRPNVVGAVGSEKGIEQEPPPGSRGNAVVIVADGTVDDFMADSIRRRVDEARELGADAIILQLDTYGGLVTAGLDISRFIKQQTDIPIICYVENRAISAGAMIALACDEIVMGPATLIGDSGVIAMGAGGGTQELGSTERAKAESPVLAEFDDSARRNGYSPLLARSFVRVEAVVYAVENLETGERRIVDAEEYDRLVTGGPFTSQETNWQPVPDVPIPLDSAESLLTVSDQVAQRIGLSQGTYNSPAEYAADQGYVVSATLTPGAGERLVGLLSSYVVRGLLMTVLFFSVYAAFSTPGTGVPEVVAAVALAVLFGVPWLTGFAEWYEVLLVLLGIVLLVVEIFIIPGFGIFGIAGLISIFLGLALTFVGPLNPPGLPAGFGIDWTNFGYGLLTALVGMVCSLLLWLWLSRYLPKLPFANRMLLRDEEPSEQEKALAAAWPTVGSVGMAVSDLRPGGTAKFAVTDEPDDTANADVVSDRGYIEAGTPLTVVEVAGNRVVVRPTGQENRVT